MKYLILPVLCVPLFSLGATRQFFDKKQKPCKERKAYYYRDVDTLPNRKFSVTTYKVENNQKIRMGIYSSLIPDIIDTLWTYNSKGEVAHKRAFERRSEVVSYYPDGARKSLTIKINNSNTRQTTAWYPNGNLRYKYQTVNNGEMDGEVVSYYPNGQLKRRETYIKDVRQGDGERYDSTGNPMKFYPFMEKACFGEYVYESSCIKNFWEYLSKNTKYPHDAAKEGVQGRAIVQFTINTEGETENVKLLRTAGHSSLDQEALRVVEDSPKWTPAKVDGETIRILYTTPVSFMLDGYNPNTQWREPKRVGRTGFGIR